MDEARAHDKELKAQAADLASQRERASRLLSVKVHGRQSLNPVSARCAKSAVSGPWRFKALRQNVKLLAVEPMAFCSANATGIRKIVHKIDAKLSSCLAFRYMDFAPQLPVAFDRTGPLKGNLIAASLKARDFFRV